MGRNTVAPTAPANAAPIAFSVPRRVIGFATVRESSSKFWPTLDLPRCEAILTPRTPAEKGVFPDQLHDAELPHEVHLVEVDVQGGDATLAHAHHVQGFELDGLACG